MTHKQAFIKLFKETARYHHRYEVFRDFVHCAAYSIHNGIALCEKVESDYLDIAKRYKKDDLIRFCHLLSHVVEGLEEKTCDFLGSLFMELELGSSQIGQFFTPYEVSLMMAKMLVGADKDKYENMPVIDLHEPAVGSGSMVIAYAEALRDIGVNYQEKMWVQAIDLDSVAAMMAYIQLSLLYVPGEVCVGNTLTLDIHRTFKTPAHYLGRWESKMERYRVENGASELMKSIQLQPSQLNEQCELLFE